MNEELNLNEEIAMIMEELEELVNKHPIIQDLSFCAPSICCEGEMMTYMMKMKEE